MNRKEKNRKETIIGYQRGTKDSEKISKPFQGSASEKIRHRDFKTGTKE